MMRVHRNLMWLPLVAVLGGCATFSKDGGFDSVAQLTEAGSINRSRNYAAATTRKRSRRNQEPAGKTADCR